MGDTAPSSRQSALFPIAGSWKMALIAGILMVLLALLGVGLTTTSRSAAPAYWVALVPIYGLICIATAAARVRQGETAARPAIARQVLHWVAIGVALALDFWVRGTGEETGAAAGLNALLLLALGCFLAGIHLDWLFTLVGVLLALVLVVVAKAEQYLWLIFVVGVVAILVMFAWSRWLTPRRLPAGKPDAAPGA